MKSFVACLLFAASFAFSEWGPKEVHALLLSRTAQKYGVQTGKLDAAMDTAGLVVVAEFHRAMGDSYRPTITSANDFAWHARFSRHYYNKALDFRLFDVPREKRSDLILSIRRKLGSRFLVLWENAGKRGEHLHIELRDDDRN